MEIKGKVYAVLPMVEGTSANGAWKRQTVVVEYQDGQYTSKVALDSTKKADEFAKVEVGTEYTFKCNTPTSREYNGRWYTSITCWGWDKNGNEDSVPQPQVAPAPQAQVAPTSQVSSEEMPF